MDVCLFKNKVFYDFRKITEKIGKIFSPIGEKYGFTMLQLMILFELFHHNCHTVGSLASNICMAEGNLSVMCKKLEQRGFVRRVRNRDDERVVQVMLSDMGEKTILEIELYLNQRFEEELSLLDESSHEEIIKGLDKLNILLAIMCEGENNKFI